MEKEKQGNFYMVALCPFVALKTFLVVMKWMFVSNIGHGLLHVTPFSMLIVEGRIQCFSTLYSLILN